MRYSNSTNRLIAATCIEDLFVFNSLNFEALSNGFFSIRIDYHYRLLFTTQTIENTQILTICTIHDITNHYK